jgi:tetratricopeptide (TPR) repeat protein
MLRAILASTLSLFGGFASDALAQGFGGTVSDILVRADSLLAQNRANEAAVQFQEARTLCTTPAEMVAALQGEARAHMAMREPLVAAGLLEEAAQRYPDDPRLSDILFLAGIARRQGGDLAAAAPLLRQALDHHPTPDLLPNITFELARALRLTGKPEEAIPILKDFETTYKQHPMIPGALYTLAISQHDAGMLADSEATYRHLIQSYPHTQATLEAFFELGLVISERGGSRGEAAEFLRRFANGAPSSPLSARAMELAADLTLFSSPKEASVLYGVAQAKAQSNPPPPSADLQVSRWVGLKKAFADTIGSVWMMGLVLLVLVGVAVAVFVLLRRRQGRGTAPAGGAAGAAGA